MYSSNYRYIYEAGKLVHEDKAGCGFKNYRIIENIVNLQAELDGNLLYKGYINKYEVGVRLRIIENILNL